MVRIKSFTHQEGLKAESEKHSQSDGERAGLYPSNRKKRLFWDLIHTPTPPESGGGGGGAGIKEKECLCVCVCACLCQKQKANKRQVEGDISSDVRRTAAEGYKKKPYSQ